MLISSTPNSRLLSQPWEQEEELLFDQLETTREVQLDGNSTGEEHSPTKKEENNQTEENSTPIQPLTTEPHTSEMPIQDGDAILTGQVSSACNYYLYNLYSL